MTTEEHNVVPTLETLTEADLHGLLYAASLRRARGYLDAVLDPARSGQTLTAKVRGTQVYAVEINVGSDGVQAHCTCPYDWGGYCKHVGAVLLKWIQSPGSFVHGATTPMSADEDQPLFWSPVELPPPHLPRATPQWMTETFQQRQARWAQSLQERLSWLKMADLRQVIRNRGWAIKGARKDTLAQEVAAHLSDTEDMRRAVLTLDDAHRQILRAQFCLCSVPLGVRDLQRVAVSWGALQPHEHIASYTRHLRDAGLSLPNDDASDPQLDHDVIPYSLARHLPPLLDNLASDLPMGTPATDLRIADPFALVRLANVVTRQLEQSPEPLRPAMPRPRLASLAWELEGWDYVPAEVQRIAQGGRPGQRRDLELSVLPPARLLPDDAVARLAPVTGGEAQLEFMLRLLLEVGIFLEGSPLTVWKQVRAHFLQHDDLEQRAILARSFFRMSQWSVLWEILMAVQDLRLVRCLHLRYFRPQQLWAILESLQHRTLWVLASLPEGRWIALPDLLAFLRSLWPGADATLRGSSPYSGASLPHTQVPWHLVYRGSRLNDRREDDWDLVQGNYVRLLITGPLHWLGLADLHLDDQKPAAFRLKGLGDLFWDRVEAPPAAPQAAGSAAPVRISAPMTIEDERICVDPAAVSAQAHSLLDQIARLELVETGRLVYRLDPEAAYQAFEAGASLAQLLDDWAQLLPIPMPQQLRSRLAAWWDAYGQVRIYQDVTVIEFGDDYALEEMKAVTSLQDHLYAEVCPRVVMVRSEAVSQLMVELENAGYTPRQAEDPPS